MERIGDAKVGGAGAAAGCGERTKLIDHTPTCASDGRLHGLQSLPPYCRDNVCIASGFESDLLRLLCGLGRAEDATQDNFLNQCSAGFLPPRWAVRRVMLDDMNRSFSPTLVSSCPDPVPRRQDTPRRSSIAATCAGRKTSLTFRFQQFPALLRRCRPPSSSASASFRVPLTTSCSGAHSMNPMYPADHTSRIPRPAVPMRTADLPGRGRAATIKRRRLLLGSSGRPLTW